jgi:predicted neutral ceramidase superfamily lipid hydrolase
LHGSTESRLNPQESMTQVTLENAPVVVQRLGEDAWAMSKRIGTQVNDIRAAMTKMEEGLRQEFGKWETVIDVQVKHNDLETQLPVAKNKWDVRAGELRGMINEMNITVGNNKTRQEVEISKGTVDIEQLEGELAAFRTTFENNTAVTNMIADSINKRHEDLNQHIDIIDATS